jgi:osmotically inducible protein OsmC
MTDRVAHAIWEGPLTSGKGDLEFASSGIGRYPLAWSSRVESPDGRTSPEELLAAAHAACYAMAFSHALAQAGTPAERLHVSSTVTVLPKQGGGLQITRSALEVEGVVPGLDAEAFRKTAEAAEQSCPVSNVIRNNAEITLNANLKSG